MTPPPGLTDTPDLAWEDRCVRAWGALQAMPSEAFVLLIDELAAELPADSAIGQFERACARDSTGRSDLAAPLYRAALASGLEGLRRRRATIQLASSLRNLGRPQEAADMLMAETRMPSDELDGAVQAFLALALADMGRDREALQASLLALSKYLPRYNASLARYANDLLPRREPASPKSR